MKHIAPRSLAFLVAIAAFSCGNPQRLADPLFFRGDPAARESVSSAPTEVGLVLRHAGPVEVRPAGSPAGHLLSFDHKMERLDRGARVRVGAGGRAELLRRGSRVSVVLFGPALAQMGDPRSDEPLIQIHAASAVSLLLTAEDRVALPGGALLRWEGMGEEPAAEGRLKLVAEGNGVLRLGNESSGRAIVRYRDATLDVSPGESLDLPSLAHGTAPFERPPTERSVERGGIPFLVWGSVESDGDGGDLRELRMRSSGSGGVRGQGIEISFSGGDEVVMKPLGERAAESGSSPQE